MPPVNLESVCMLRNLPAWKKTENKSEHKGLHLPEDSDGIAVPRRLRVGAVSKRRTPNHRVVVPLPINWVLQVVLSICNPTVIVVAIVVIVPACTRTAVPPALPDYSS